MKFKKGALVDILSFIIIFILFTACIIAFLFNNSLQERRSLFVDFLNKETMALQASLEGYSNNPSLCFMYRDGNRLEFNEATRYKNLLIDKTRNNIQNYFNNQRVKKVLTLENVDISIKDTGNVLDTASINITVDYKGKFKTPYSDTKVNANASDWINLKDSASRNIENPTRAKNTNYAEIGVN